MNLTRWWPLIHYHPAPTTGGDQPTGLVPVKVAAGPPTSSARPRVRPVTASLLVPVFDAAAHIGPRGGQDTNHWLRVLHELLEALDPATAGENLALLDIVTEHLRYGSGWLGTGQEQAWSLWAYTTSHRRFGPEDARTVTAAEGLAWNFAENGDHAAAALVQIEVVDHCRRTGDRPAVMRARAELAQMWHDAGRCEHAITEIQQVFADWQDDSPTGHLDLIIDSYLHILYGCDRTSEAETLRTLARTLGCTLTLDDIGLETPDDRATYAAKHLRVCTHHRHGSQHTPGGSAADHHGR